VDISTPLRIKFLKTKSLAGHVSAINKIADQWPNLTDNLQRAKQDILYKALSAEKNLGKIEIEFKDGKGHIIKFHTDEKNRVYQVFPDSKKNNHQSTYKEMQDYVDQLPKGKMLFDAPDVMQLECPEKVYLRITRHFYEDLKKGLEKRGVRIGKNIAISDVMKATLINAQDDFIISLEGDRDNAKSIVDIDDKKYVQWTWNVKPLKTGRKVLQLNVYLIIRRPGYSDAKVDYRSEKKIITVEVTEAKALKFFFTKNWKWITRIIIAILAMLLSYCLYRAA